MRSTNEVYGSLAYDGASLLHVPVCVSRPFLVNKLVPQLYCICTSNAPQDQTSQQKKQMSTLAEL